MAIEDYLWFENKDKLSPVKIGKFYDVETEKRGIYVETKPGDIIKEFTKDEESTEKRKISLINELKSRKYEVIEERYAVP